MSHTHVCTGCKERKPCDCAVFKKRVNWGCRECRRRADDNLMANARRLRTILAIKSSAVVLSALLIIGIGPVRAEIPAGGIWALYGSCDISAGIFLTPGGGTPRKDCDYPLGNAVVFQKVSDPDGYLLAPDLAAGDVGSDVMFLKTEADLPQGLEFNGTARVHWIGSYEYAAVNGFRKKVFAFESVEH